MADINNTTDAHIDLKFPSNSTGAFWCIFYSLQAVIITILNSFTIATFVINPHLRKRSSYCIVNLAIADLLVGAVAIPFNVYLVGVLFSFWGTFDTAYLLTVIHSHGTIYIFTGIASLFSLVLVSLERVLATVCPLQHLTTSTLTYIVGFVVTWMLSGIVATVWVCSLMYYNIEIALYLWMPSLLFSLLAICIAYIGVYVAVKLHNSKQQSAIKKCSFQREKELAITLFIVATISLLCWVPFTVIQVINFKNGIVSYNTVNIVNAIANANSLVNPIIYVFRMQSFRSALVQLLTKCARDRFRRKTSSSQSATDGLLSKRKVTRATLIRAVTDV